MFLLSFVAENVAVGRCRLQHMSHAHAHCAVAHTPPVAWLKIRSSGRRWEALARTGLTWRGTATRATTTYVPQTAPAPRWCISSRKRRHFEGATPPSWVRAAVFVCCNVCPPRIATRPCPALCSRDPGSTRPLRRTEGRRRAEAIVAFMGRVEGALPATYDFFPVDSLHVTLLALS